ncbi:asparagine synthase-domain-containing protein [Chytriomyces sp. MP71]|nr:asparagine synthase-domain-containing protein [Chytriomyces sp. MP71]
MCGILFRAGKTAPSGTAAGLSQFPHPLRIVTNNGPERATCEPPMWRHLVAAVGRRGCDAQHAASVEFGSSTASASVFASVLRLRGSAVVAQPRVRAEDGSFLCWNGELFADADSAHSDPLQMRPGESDTDIVFNELLGPQAASQPFKPWLLKAVARIRGPWAILVFHAPSSTLYFGRDFLGRRSLLVHFPDNSANLNIASDGASFLISSVSACIEDFANQDGEATKKDDDAMSETSKDDATDAWWGDGEGFWLEVPANGLYSLCLADIDFDDGKESFRRCLTHIPWIPAATASEMPESCLIAPLNAILNTTIPSSDLLSSYPSYTESLEVPIPISEECVDALAACTALLSSSVKVRIETIHQQQGNESEPLAILFSGGLDCMLLAALAAKNMGAGASIDLLNVAFDNPRVRKAAAAQKKAAVKHVKMNKKSLTKQAVTQMDGGEDAEVNGHEGNKGVNANVAASPLVQESSNVGYPSHIFAVPDRKTGLKGYEELKRTYPHILWRFVEIDVEFKDALSMRPWILGLVNPLQSVMDLSIAMAFWFAARGHGAVLNDNGERIPYQTTAKVLLSGLGADEQLGGYNRHRKSYEQNGWSGLIFELQKDVSRISKRNLGRDDRIVSDHNREIRFPYLSESLITYLSSLPVHIKTDPRLPRGVGDKLLLRQMAASLGLVRASVEVKRAVQFGARTAKMINGREKGDMGVTV